MVFSTGVATLGWIATSCSIHRWSSLLIPLLGSGFVLNYFSWDRRGRGVGILDVISEKIERVLGGDRGRHDACGLLHQSSKTRARGDMMGNG
jgi:hypothetical protein